MVSFKKRLCQIGSCDTTRYKEIIQTGQATTEHPHCRNLNSSVDLWENARVCYNPSLGDGTWLWVLHGLSPGDKHIAYDKDNTMRELCLQGRAVHFPPQPGLGGEGMEVGYTPVLSG